MKRGKDEDKTMGPMFPRLRVSEIEKRGPRAPPRNKMALYEQLSIPSQRFTGTVGFVLDSSQGGGSEKGIFVSRQLLPRHQSEKQYSQFSDSSAPVTQVDQRKELDDDDFRVPIFIHSKSTVEHGKSTNVSIAEKPSPSNISYINPLFKFRKANIQKEEKLKELVADPDKTISNSPSLCQQTIVNLLGSIERLKSGGSVQLEVCPELQPVSNTLDSAVCEELISTLDKKSSVIVGDLSYDAVVTEPEKDQPRVDIISETSITDTIAGLEITPDDVVGILGQKRFWKARRTIVNQQRAFADQVFELHRLMKVQKSIASSPHFLLEDVVHISKPVKALTEKIVSLDCPSKALPNVSNPKVDPKRHVTEEGSAENSIVKSSLSSVQNNSLPPNFEIACNQVRPWGFNQPHGPQWLVPVISPSEGLVYKPYPGPGYVSPSVPSNNFMTTYGVPAIHPQFQLASFSAPGPHPYFPTYGMPAMSTASFSSSSGEQVNQPSIPGLSQLANPPPPSQRNISGAGQENLQLPEDIEVQASTASSRSERAVGSGSGNVLDKRNVLRLFPTSEEPECPTPTRVIKVIPHKAGSASESVARIFRSIQEERTL